MRLPIYNKPTQFLVDGITCAVAWVTAYLIRYDNQLPSSAQAQMIALLLPVVALQVLTSVLLRIYKFQWRYVNAGDAISIGRAYALLGAILLGVRFIPGQWFPLLAIPLGVIINTVVFAFGGAVTVRLIRRVLYQRGSAEEAHSTTRRFLLVGAGKHGATVAREMLLRRGIEVIGFVDDDPGKQGAIIAGVKVLGRTADLPEIAATHKIDEVLVCISPESRSSLQLEATTNGMAVRSRIVPTIEDVLGSETGFHCFVSPAATANANGNGTTAGANGNVATHASVASHQPGNGRAASEVHQITELTPIPRAVRSVPASPTLENKTVLITGGAGFIGSSLAELLAGKNRVILLDQAFEGTPLQYTSLLRNPNVSTVQGSILEVDLRSLVKQADVVVHAAAILGVHKVCSAGRETLETNYVGTSRLLKALDASPDIQRFVYFSTSEVFGVNSYRVNEASRPTIGPIAESRWSYAMSKLAGEHLVASYFRETHLPIAIVRPFNIFGPRRTGDYALKRFIVSALHGEPVEVHGDGTQIRSWCYIDDFCSALLQMMVRPEAVGEDFNIGNPGNTLTVYELALKVIQLANSSSSVVFCESPFPDISIRVPSLVKAKKLLGYEPRFDLNTGLKHTIQWYREHLSLFQPPNAQAAVESRLAA